MAVKKSREEPVPRTRGAKDRTQSTKLGNPVQQNPGVPAGSDGETKEVMGGSIVKNSCDKGFKFHSDAIGTQKSLLSR